MGIFTICWSFLVVLIYRTITNHPKLKPFYLNLSINTRKTILKNLISRSTLVTLLKCRFFLKIFICEGIYPIKIIVMHKTLQNGILYLAYTLLLTKISPNPISNAFITQGSTRVKNTFRVRKLMISWFWGINTNQNKIFVPNCYLVGKTRV